MAISTNKDLQSINEQLTASGSYSNTVSGLDANTIKDAIDEIAIANPSNISTEATSTVTAVVGEIQLVDVSGGAVTVNPPAAPVAKDSFTVVDTRGDATVNNITIDFVTAGQNLHATSQNDTISVDEGHVKYVYVNGTVGWIRVA